MATEYAELGDNNSVPVESGGTGETTVQGVIDSFGIFLALSAAAAYDPEGSYAVGDYCTHSGKLHKCNTPIPSGEAWNAEHWTETTVAKELSKKVDVVEDICADLNDFLSVGRYVKVDESTGNLPDPSIDFGRAYNIGLSDTALVQIVYSRYGNIYARGFAAWEEPKFREWVSIATATPPEVHNLILASGVTNINGYQSVYFKTQENIVTVILQCEGAFADGQHTATLPVDCYPKRNMTIPCIDGYTRTVGFLLVNIDGTIRVSFGESEKTSAISAFSFDAAEVSK